MKNKLLMLIILLSLNGLTSGSAQSNDIIDALLEEEQACFGYTVHFVLSARGIIPEEATIQQGLSAAKAQKWRIAYHEVQDKVTAGELSLMIMKTLKLKGGIMYTLFPIPRYAYREMRFRKIIPLSLEISNLVSGEDVIRTLGKALEGEVAR